MAFTSMRKNHNLPPASDVAEDARNWANDTFAKREHVLCVVVQYAPLARERKGKKHKLVVAQEEVLAACHGNDPTAALNTLSRLSQKGDIGIAICRTVEELTLVLAERLRHKQVCYVENDFPGGWVTLLVWME